jgi:hypothetical protein
MAELKRFTDFDSLKLAAKSNKKAVSAKSKKLKEQNDFFELLRANLLPKTDLQNG